MDAGTRIVEMVGGLDFGYIQCFLENHDIESAIQIAASL